MWVLQPNTGTADDYGEYGGQGNIFSQFWEVQGVLILFQGCRNTNLKL